MNSINNIYQYNSKKVFKILIALFILLFVSYISIFKGIADINLKRVLVAIFKNLSFNNTEPLSPREIVVFFGFKACKSRFRECCRIPISNLWNCNASNYRK